ncbi:MAG TPA: DUF2207 domain-containing protein [Thermomicrobiales bacterium]|nr:DUF2207 domain-containing protein [Thermomicrobiales bacterium]
MKIRMLVVLLVLAGFLASALPAAAEGDITWQRYDVTVDIREDGTIHVTESIDVRFDGSYSHGKRTIPMDRIEGIDNVAVAVADEGGKPNPTTFRTSESGGDLVIDYDFAQTRSGDVRTILLEYDASGVIRVYPDNDPPRQEIRWTAISSEVTDIGPITQASATITFPESVEGSDATRFDPEPDATTATSVTWTKHNMGEGDALQTLASFPAMTAATEPAWQAKADKLDSRREKAPALAIVSGLVGAVGFGLIGLFSWRAGRDPEVGLVADILPEPPGDLPAALVGTLTDESFDQKDMLAMLVDLDRRGIIEISEDALSGKREDDPSRFHITLLQDADEAPEWARPMLEGLFGKNARSGEHTTFKKLKKVASSHMSALSRAVERELLQRGYFDESPSATRVRWGIRVAGMTLLMIVVFVGLILWVEEANGWLIAAAIFSGALAIVGGLLAMGTVRKSQKGAEEAAKWKAFSRYLKQMQKEMDRTERLQLIDTYLPWAIALGYDQNRWKKMMEDDRDYRWGSHQYRPWLVGGYDHTGQASSRSGGSGGGFDVQSMSNRSMSGLQAANFSMFAMLNSASKTFASGSSSSSGSGSGSASVGSSGGGGHSFS